MAIANTAQKIQAEKSITDPGESHETGPISAGERLTTGALIFERWQKLRSVLSKRQS
jgi:hypothetical protein